MEDVIDQFESIGFLVGKNVLDADGVWSLLISVEQHTDDVAQALVELSADGGVSAVRVPTRLERGWTIPRRVTAQEVEQSLQSRATRTAQARR